MLIEIELEKVFNKPAEALQYLKQYPVDILFLDIEMPVMNGFELLEQFKQIPFTVIFTTSYDQYAIKAIRFSALDYLLKPIDREDLVNAVNRAIQKKQHPFPLQLEILLQKLHHPSSSILKIALPSMDGLQMISVDDIISCESDSNYTVFFQKHNQKTIATRTMKEVEEMGCSFRYFFKQMRRYQRGIFGFAQFMNRCVTHWHFYKFTREGTAGKLRLFNSG